MKMRSKCRLWWPKHLSSTEPSSSTILFGWFISSSASLDIVVAFAYDDVSLSPTQSGLQGILRETNGNLPVFLQDKCVFSMLGHCAAGFSSNGQLPRVGVEVGNHINSSHGGICPSGRQDIFGEKYRRLSCGCLKLDGFLEQSRLASIESNNWIQLVYGSQENSGRKIKWIPQLHHIHQNQQIVSHFNLHVIFYETPEFGGHHFSLGFWSSTEQLKTPLKKPKWVEELHQKQPLLDLDTVILAINSATAAKLFFERCVRSEGSTIRFPIVCMFFTFTWQLLAVSMASLSTILYIILQFLHVFFSYGSHSWVYIKLGKVFSNTWKNVQIRCCQVFYWPIFLQDNGLRSQSCVEYAEKAALHRHSMWSSVAVDVLLGNLLGVALLVHAESACLWVSHFASDITNYWLRTGCVWLMGVPAGFKLNTELAGVLGMISLNAIQIWSTLWFFAGFLFIYFIKGLAISGLLFGLTTPAALIIDMILLATLHVSTLHWLVSLLYSQQIQAIAALWRLFRGRKWNPLRQRFDSYDYTVEQHIVGSLLFTPLLLLLPTTSVFYIFFTIINTTISFICIIIEIMISVIHATPYTKIFLWLVRPRRFPLGMWFEVISCQSNTSDSMEIGCLDDIGSPSEKSQQTMDRSRSRSSILVSFLHSNFLNIGQIVWPHYRYVFSAVSRSFVASSAYGVLTGKCIQSTLGTGLPSRMPWIFIPYKEYWYLCRDSVLGCKADCDCHVFQQSNNTKSDLI
uniref:Phosphatidylinositol N-acetylglucosaminyltransferase n=2 Tax=Davidia involucrata TaxID=16924 RepID=A0A5B6ZU59_DAVIN